MVKAGSSPADKARHGFRICLARPPSEKELGALITLYEKTHKRFAQDPDKARVIATKPIGKAREGTNLAELAAWTVVGNVLLNLDEMLMKR